MTKTVHPDLIRPTVGDVIRFLETLDQSMPFRIEDPDTQYVISIIDVWEENGKLWLTGDYRTMNHREDEEPTP